MKRCGAVVEICRWIRRARAPEGFRTLGEFVGGDEVSEMGSQLVVGLVVEVLDGRILDGAVHPLDLAVGPGMLGLCMPMIDVVARTSDLEGVRPKWLAALEHAFDVSDRLALASSCPAQPRATPAA